MQCEVGGVQCAALIERWIRCSICPLKLRYPDKMPQCQKRIKCHNVDGEIRMQQKCYKGATWYNKDVAKSVTKV